MEGFGREIDFPQSPSGAPFGIGYDAFKCEFPGCNARYRRKEHLHRHEESKHVEQHKTFVCAICGREFGRSDTLRRHAQRQHNIIEPLNRARRACASCQAGKTRCQGGVPCDECLRRKIPCSLRDQHASPTRQQGQQEQYPGSLNPRSLSSLDHEQTPPQSYCWERRKQCVDSYFETFHPRWPFIHKATFNIHRETPLLLQAMVAIGLWVSGEKSARCAAAELHEKLDLAIRDQREKWDASDVEGACSECMWPIPTYQAILLHIMFSVLMRTDGHGAVTLDLKVSISTPDLQLLQSLVGSCQRLGMFYYPNILAKYNEGDLASFVWVGIEEVKRFNIALYKFCASLSTPSSDGPGYWPLLPASQLQFPLPTNTPLWSAVGKDEWEANAPDENEFCVAGADDSRPMWISNFAGVLDSLGLGM
ncbi:C2H2 type zinc finger domain protein [Aspergillus pseudodeflectus]|uniref:C2H2 type zinc finger domain protein n=1 Tax=Aspergillus pseudodeflectus TaxID=176178 RepID=A0ABR4JXW8_9EURO